MPDYTDAVSNCLDVISNETISDNCASIATSVTDFFLEACIREYERAGSVDAQKILQYSLIYHCVSVTNVDECKFKDFFYFCDETPEDSKSSSIIIIVVVILVVSLLIAAIIAVCCIKKKLKSRKNIEEEEPFTEVSHTKFRPRKLTETSFISNRSSRAVSPTWLDDGRSSAASWRSSGSVDSRFFESPIMFIGSPPTSTQDNGRSPTPSSSRGVSPFSLFGKRSVSPQPQTISVTSHPRGESRKKVFDSNRKEQVIPPPTGGQTMDSISKMFQKARESGDASSPHPRKPQNKVSGSQLSASRSLGGPSFTPLPSANRTAPTSIFGARETPLPKFSPNAPTSILGNRETPKPQFSADSSASTRINDSSRQSPFKKGVAIPRVPLDMSLGSRGRRPSNTQSTVGSILDDLDTK